MINVLKYEDLVKIAKFLNENEYDNGNIDKDGVVTAVGEGTTVITLNVQGVEKECIITVRSKILKGEE